MLQKPEDHYSPAGFSVNRKKGGKSDEIYNVKEILETATKT